MKGICRAYCPTASARSVLKKGCRTGWASKGAVMAMVNVGAWRAAAGPMHNRRVLLSAVLEFVTHATERAWVERS